MDSIVPGGVACDLDDKGCERIAAGCSTHLEHEMQHPEGHLRRTRRRAGSLRHHRPGHARPGGATGPDRLAGRASGQSWDLRAQFPCAPYDQLDVRMATHRNGDVAARVIVRFEEILESLRLIRLILEQHAGRSTPRNRRPMRRKTRCGIGWVEGWRGEMLVALHTGKNNRSTACIRMILMAELAGAGTRDHRQHRAGFPADQQIVQPEL